MWGWRTFSSSIPRLHPIPGFERILLNPEARNRRVNLGRIRPTHDPPQHIREVRDEPVQTVELA